MFGASSQGGGLFGSTTTQSGGLFGSSTPQTGGLFGAKTSTASTGLFGSTTGTTGGLFGSTPASSAPSTGLFGSNTATSKPGGLFGSTSTSGGLFGNTAASTGGGLFGNTTTSQSGGLFGGQTNTGGGLFGNTGSTGGSLFGQSNTTGGGLFGNTSTGGGGLFGNTSSSSGGLFGAKPAQPQMSAAQQNSANLLALQTALTVPQLLPDERNNVIAKWNQIQASWGHGKAFYMPGAPPIELTPENPYCRFKTVAYSELRSSKDEDGLILLVFNKPVSEITANQQALIDALFAKVFSSNQSVTVNVHGAKPLTDQSCEVLLHVVERLPTGYTRKIAASKLYQFLQQPTQTRELTNIGVQSFVPHKSISEQDLEVYLSAPPVGISPYLWQQAKASNPDSERLLPLPVLGFKQLHQRFLHQQQMTEQHKTAMVQMNSQLVEIRNQQATSQAKLDEHKRKVLELGHRMIKVVSQVERLRKVGYSIQEDEDVLHRQLEMISMELSQPTGLKSRLVELVSHTKLGNQLGTFSTADAYTLSEDQKSQVIDFLKKQQEGISCLVSMMKETMDDVKIIQEGIRAG